MGADDADWMAYIDTEVRAVCQPRGWRHQIRRKWSIRDKPVSDSGIDDYEWKLIPDAQRGPADAPRELWDEEGVYYVLWFNMAQASFFLQHSTSRCGRIGPHWERTTYTEIETSAWTMYARPGQAGDPGGHPPLGWLRRHLEDLTREFRPNAFSET
jgi:hypothetical protein